jgi:predicted lipase
LNAIVVIFRGSANFQNWLTNLNTVRTSYPACGGCSVHSGFYSGYNSVSSTVKNDVNNLKSKYRDAKLIIAGHSLGGALAILAAADLVNLHAIDATYTFGQPRIGNDAFAAWYPTRVRNTFRVIHYADIVPHVPPASFGFVHSST